MPGKTNRNENVWDGPPISNRIDLRLHLTDQQFRARVLQAKAWADYLKLPPIPHFDEPAALAEIAHRNAVRAESDLPLLDAKQELARLRQAYELARWSERFYDVCFRCIREIYGPIEASDFNSMSAMAGFFAHRQNLIDDLMHGQSASGRRR